MKNQTDTSINLNTDMSYVQQERGHSTINTWLENSINLNPVNQKVKEKPIMTDEIENSNNLNSILTNVQVNKEYNTIQSQLENSRNFIST